MGSLGGGNGGGSGGARGNSSGGIGNLSFNDEPNDSFCSVTLPPIAAIADENAAVAQRCFIVCVSQVNQIITFYVRSVFKSISFFIIGYTCEYTSKCLQPFWKSH